MNPPVLSECTEIRSPLSYWNDGGILLIFQPNKEVSDCADKEENESSEINYEHNQLTTEEVS